MFGPSKELLQEKLHLAIASARERLASQFEIGNTPAGAEDSTGKRKARKGKGK
jgi:hypothetical protein